MSLLRSFTLLTFVALSTGCILDWDRLERPVSPSTDLGDDIADGTDATDATDAPSGDRPQCTPSNDTCPRGQYCSPAMNQCVSGCRVDMDCAGMNDGGADPFRCNAGTCVRCVTDTHCPLGQLCMGNTCVMGCNAARGCPAGATCCGGGCVDTQSNTMHCGACGSACSVSNGTPACVAGACAIDRCMPGRGDCDRSVANGCEADTMTSTANCGMCGNACPTIPRSTSVCMAGRCAMGECEAGFADCDRNPANGCETSLRNDAMNCGACGTVCRIDGAAAMCSSGMCVRSRCEAGRGDCDGDPSNGCEVDFTRDAMNCGRCGVTCAAPGATPACVASVCGIGRCNTGLGDCDGNLANGCETDLTTSLNHCMTCGNVCVASGATPTCRASRCGFSMCNAGRADCDTMEANGCEIDTRTNIMHCGGCGRACVARPNASVFCADARCGLTCAANFDNCDGSDTNGCETDTRTSAAHCGGCGRTCTPLNAVGSCTGGVCRLTRCNTGFGDCDGNPSNGCETDLASSVSDCGACGRGCSFANATGTCSASVCRVTMCTGTFGNCDGNDANGCESNLIASASHCGACGMTCPTGRTCQVGRCTVPSFAGYMQTTPPATVTYIDACALPGREQVLAGQDDAFSIGRLPFNVDFWGARNNEYLINTNGFVGFGTLFYNLTRPGGGDNFPEMGPLASWGSLPTTSGFAPGAYIMGIDLVMSATGICMGTRGAAPNRQWIVDYRSARIFTAALGPSNLSFELIVNETTNILDVLYQTVTFPASATPTAPDFITIGIQNHIAPPGAQAVSYTGSVNASTRIRWQPR